MSRKAFQPPRFNETPVTFAIAAVTTLVSLAVMVVPGLTQAVASGGFIPASWAGLIGQSGLAGAAAPAQAIPPHLTPISSALLHSGFVHLLFNLIMLIFCGRQVEAAVGGRGVFILYAVGVYASAVVQWLADTGSIVPVIGASGAISAIVGAYSAMFTRQKVQGAGPMSGYALRIVWLAVAWIALQLLFGAVYNSDNSSGIAIWGHIGGFLAGLLLARPLLKRRYSMR